jgi:hypothetical protein
MIDSIEEALEVRFGHIVDRAALDGASQLIQGAVLTAPRPISKTTVQEIGLIYGLQYPPQRLLHQLVL